jgi:conjugal transfer ATP-binding protein TraC
VKLPLLSRPKESPREKVVPDGWALTSGMVTAPDLIAPDGILEMASCLQVGPDRYARTYVVTAIPSVLVVGWLDDLYQMGDIDVSIYVHPCDERDVINKLTRKINDMESQIYLDEKRGDSRFFSVNQRIRDDAAALRDQIQMNQNRMFYVTIIFTVARDTEEELNRACRMVEEQLGGHAIHTRQAFLRQLDAFRSVSPICDNRLFDVHRNFDLGAATSLFPFGGSDLAHPGGIFLGENKVTGAPVFFNSFAGPPEVPNRHIGVFATSGAGKTTLIKLMVARSCLQGIRTVFIDPEGEYSQLATQLGGVHVRLAPEGKVYINPFDLEPEVVDGVATVDILEKVADLKGLIALMIEGAGTKMSAEEAALVETALQEEYATHGITKDPNSLYEEGTTFENGSLRIGKKRKEMPTLTSFWQRLSQDPKAERLCLLLKQYLRGNSLGLFDGQSAANLGDAPLVSIDVFNLEEKFARPYAMAVALSWIWDKFVKGNPEVKKRVVVDEAWLFMKYKDTAEFLANMARRARKRMCSLVVSTQNFTEFGSPEGKSVIANLGTVILMMQAPHELANVAQAFHLNDGETAYLRTCGIGDVLLKANSQSASTSVALNVTVAEHEWQFIAGGGR